MRTVILGGSFDPIHIGHLFLAEELMSQLGYERVILIPTFEAPHKELSGQASPEQRLEMLYGAVEGMGGLIVDECEIARGGRSYTIDTIPMIKKSYDLTGRLGLVVGDDLLDGFHTWKSHEALVEMVDLVVAHRYHAEKRDFPYPHRYVDNLLLPISSRDIRERVATGRAFRHIVPESVFRYIQMNMLYTRRDLA